MPRRPGGWDGASEAQQRSRQVTDELLSFLESAAPGPPTNAPAALAARPPRPGQARQQAQGSDGVAAAGDASGDALPQPWRFGLRLAGHCCAAGLLDAGKVAEWAAGSRLLLALPAAARRQVLALLELSLPAAQLAHQQVLSLLELCLKGAEAAGAAAAAKRGRASRDAAEVQQGLLQAAAQLVSLHPAAFVAADEQLLQPLSALPGGSSSVQLCTERITSARQRLSQALHARWVPAPSQAGLPLRPHHPCKQPGCGLAHIQLRLQGVAWTNTHDCGAGGWLPHTARCMTSVTWRLLTSPAACLACRVLHWHDAKALQLMDRQLRAGSSAAAAAEALLKLLLGQPAAAAAPPVLGEAVRLVCDWAVAAPAADFGAALAEAAGAAPAGDEGWRARGVPALHPDRVLFALAVLHALQAQQQQEPQGEQSGDQQSKRQKQERAQAGLGAAQQAPAAAGKGSGAPRPLQAALSVWLSRCASDPQLPQRKWLQQRLLHLTLLVAEAGLLCPEAHLRTCLATGAFQAGPEGGPAEHAAGAKESSTSSSGVSSTGPASFHLAVVEQLHPLLDYPTLAGSNGSPSSSGGKAGGSAKPGASAWPLARQRFAWARAAVLERYGPAAAASAAVAAPISADEALAAEWEELLRAPTPGSSECRASSDSSDGGSQADVEGSGHAQRGQRWQEPALRALQQELLLLLGLRPAAAAGGPAHSGSPEGAAAAGPSRSVSPVADVAAGIPSAEVPFGDMLARVRQLQPWQQRHIAGTLLAAAKAFLAGTDSCASGRRSTSPAATPAAASPGPASSSGLTPIPRWLLRSLALLQACGGHREVLSLISTCLNVLQRAVAAAVRAATGGQQGQQARPELGEALSQAQQRWQRSSRVPPGLLFALLSAHAGSLAASDIAAKLLPMLTGGLWRLHQPHHQKAAQQSLAPQLELAAELLALPGNACRQWLEKMEQQHGSKHWVAAQLQQRAAALRAQRGSGGATQQAVQQAASACLQAFVRRAQQLPMAHGRVLNGPGDSGSAGITSGTDGEQPDVAALLLQPPSPSPAGTAAAEAKAGTGESADGGILDAGDADADAYAAALAAAQHSLAPAALPAVLQHLGQHTQGQGQGPGLQALLLALCPAASQALLLDARQAHSALHHHAHLPGVAGSAPAASWQLALALFASAGSHGGSAGGGQTLLRLNTSEVMVAAVAAAMPSTGPCCWLLLRLLLDEQQRQGGHRLAEGERQLAARWVLAHIPGPLLVCLLPLRGGQPAWEGPLPGPAMLVHRSTPTVES